ncbi:MAG: hypothetical protein EHM68_16770 [Lysobacterales bacterium]|nr:MAG: hypothetical protein EHM68_16770 [Xanthomonadales bacterium]
METTAASWSSKRGPPKRLFLCDNHCYLPPVPSEKAVAQLQRHKQAGFDLVFLNLGDAGRTLEQIVRMAAFLRDWLARNADGYALVGDVESVRQANASGRLAVAFDVEGLVCVGDQLSVIPLLADLGVRWAALVYNRRNLIGYGCHDPDDQGLTPFGKRVVEAMDRAGIIKCCSHAGYRTALEIIESGEKPSMFSHSNPRALVDHQRNIPDGLIKACARRGGLIGINGIALFLGCPKASPGVIVEHIDYVAQLVGCDHVGLGFDFGYTDGLQPQMDLADSYYWPPGNGYEKPVHSIAPDEAIEGILAGLDRLGYGAGDIDQICGGNLLRLGDEVWSGA